MPTLAELHEKKKAFIFEEAEKIKAYFEETGEMSMRVDTCPTNSFGWSLDKHNAMTSIAYLLESSEGIKMSHQVRHDVHEWTFYI